MKVFGIIQARMNSSRLPGKVLFDLHGKSVLERMIERVSKSKELDKLIVATTVNPKDDKIFDLCRKLDVEVFRGSEFDVLDRFVQVAEKYKIKNLVRLTSDCPMHDFRVIDNVIRIYKSKKYDYVSNISKRTFPDGLDVEVFSFKSLLIAYNKTSHKLHREHVTTYIRGGVKGLSNGDFKKYNLMNPIDYSNLRWTLDDKKDYANIIEYFNKLPENFSWIQAINLKL